MSAPATSEAGARNAGHVSASTYSRADLNRLARQTANRHGFARYRWDLRIGVRSGVTLIVACSAGDHTEFFHIAI